MREGVLHPIQSAWNTPLLTIKKPHTNDYWPIQDLRDVNKRVIDIYPVIPKPYTLLPPDNQWYTVLDLKDAFFSLSLAPRNQEYFAFEWHNLDIRVSGQLAWTRLPQGFKNSLTILDEALHEDLNKRQGVVKGVLTQNIGPWKRPVVYLSKKLDPVTTGWPPCLRIIAAMALLVNDVDKLTMGQNLVVATPHAMESILKQSPNRWMSNAGVTHYQALLLNPARITFQVPTALNLATLLPDPDLKAPLLDCAEILAKVHCVQPDLRDVPLTDAEETWFTDGSSFVWDGHKYTGVAVRTAGSVVWVEARPSSTSAQRAELIALTKALHLAKDKKVNSYTDTRLV
ncbi:hypothetical protein STEG23_022243 [Scotinomys teguina]